MGVAQIFLIIWLGVNLLTSAYLHGKPKSGNHNFWVDVITILILFLILYLGGFFN